MGLLSALDSHKSSEALEYREFEYRLYSMGEIYPPFMGDREHSDAARYILKDFPFKVFSSSAPYEVLPQKLTLTFKIPILERNEFPDEIASEFAAFLSLVTRRRVFVDRQIRRDGLPIEEKIELYPRSNYHEEQRLREIKPVDIYDLLEKLRLMDRRLAEVFILAMRMYHSAIEIIYTEPEFSYLFLIMCIETIASSAVKQEDILSLNSESGIKKVERFLDSTFPNWRTLCDISSQESRQKVINMLLTKQYFVTSKFVKFIADNTPEYFWTEDKDDAKPDYASSVVGPSGIQTIRSDITIRAEEKIPREYFEEVLKKTYHSRSKLVHEGTRFPSWITYGLFRGYSVQVISALPELIKKPQDKEEVHIPTLLTFERLVSYCLVGFLRQGQDKHSFS